MVRTFDEFCAHQKIVGTRRNEVEAEYKNIIYSVLSAGIYHDFVREPLFSLIEGKELTVGVLSKYIMYFFREDAFASKIIVDGKEWKPVDAVDPDSLSKTSDSLNTIDHIHLFISPIEPLLKKISSKLSTALSSRYSSSEIPNVLEVELSRNLDTFTVTKSFFTR